LRGGKLKGSCIAQTLQVEVSKRLLGQKFAPGWAGTVWFVSLSSKPFFVMKGRGRSCTFILVALLRCEKSWLPEEIFAQHGVVAAKTPAEIRLRFMHLQLTTKSHGDHHVSDAL